MANSFILAERKKLDVAMSIAQEHCAPNCKPNEKCLKVYESEELQPGSFQCIDTNNYIYGNFGNPRQCGVKYKGGCKSRDAFVDFPYQCCGGVAVLRSRGNDKIGLACYYGSDYCINGCEASYNCPGNEFCSEGKCVNEKSGVNCGDCENLPINGKCCGRGVLDHNGVCYCSTGSASCKEGGCECVVNMDCCDDGRCCRSGTCTENGGTCSI
ncbi:hypothetical protein BJ944DRAFT_241335 [Cunninghamella echinulata]|nr:hypothetical protein BJ944DRAFT_241335 [Cunninghamella echinulata]